MRYFIHLAYQGTNYSGWQRQSTARSVQEVIEDAISRVLKKKLFIHGCGRTDAGVHASQYFAHVDISDEIDFDFVQRLNLVLPDDIAFYHLLPVSDDSHAQYDADFRSYTYHFHTQKIPALAQTSAYYNVENLDFKLIHEALDVIRNTSDFRSLCKNPDIYKHTRCKISSIDIYPSTIPNAYRMEITADRFLRGMIRYIMARLIDIGTHRLSVEMFASTLSNKAEFDFRYQKKGYPQGLYLSRVVYPYLQMDSLSKTP